MNIESSEFEGGIFYRVMHDDERSGEVRVVYSAVLDYEGTIKDKAVELGLSPEELIAQITDFYPNGKTGDWSDDAIVPFMRQGVGSELLERVVEDSVTKGARLMYVETGKDSMRAFLQKKGFQEFRGERAYMSYFFKAL